ncbi:Rsp5p-dependent ubiquitination, sorting of cargo proteins at the multivesicular body, partial [Ascosphaera pollenicola]
MSNQATIRIIRELSNIQQSNDLCTSTPYHDFDENRHADIVSSAITAACHDDDDDVRRLTGLIVGPPDTPYEFGFFEFSITFPNNYPTEPPAVTCLTTNNGCTRFNPNIYANGKVCLSILGTWSGSSGEQWSSAQGLESILLSVQSLMSANPYSNEPGFEHQSERDKKIAQDYIEKIRHETLRISVIQRLERALAIVPPDPAALKRKHSALKADDATATANGSSASFSASASATGQDPSKKKEKCSSSSDAFLLSLLMPTPPPSTAPASTAPTTSSSGIVGVEFDLPSTNNNANNNTNIQNTPFFARRADPFNDLLKRRFLWYYDTYHATIQRGIEKYPRHTPFSRTPFELGANSMDGTFQYRELLPRLVGIRAAIMEETLAWGLAGYDALLKEGRVWNTLKRQ